MRCRDAVKKIAQRTLNSSQLAMINDAARSLEAIGYHFRSGRALAHMHKIISARPLMVNLETVSRCNARCVFCARRKISQTADVMPLALFTRICSEYSEMGGGFLGFSPLLADPMLDPLLFERISILDAHFPAISMHMFTNGIAFSTFSDYCLLRLLTRCKIINISLGGLNREEYATMMGVDCFESVWGSLIRLSEMKRAHGLSCRLALHIRTFRRQETLRSGSLGMLRKLGYDCDDIMDSFSGWDGLVTQADLPQGTHLIKRNNARCKGACVIAMSYMTIMPDGRVLTCGCIDANETTRIGHLDDSTLREIWLGGELKAFRNSFLNGNLYPVCRSCGYYKNYKILFSRNGFRNFNPSSRSLWECL